MDRVVMVTDDLMFESRLRSALRDTDLEVATSRGAELPPSDLIFIDLNRDLDTRLEVIARVRHERPTATIIGFCHHGADAARRDAMARGATQAVTNEAVPAVALRLAGAGDDAGAKR